MLDFLLSICLGTEMFPSPLAVFPEFFILLYISLKAAPYFGPNRFRVMIRRCLGRSELTFNLSRKMCRVFSIVLRP